jgi:hypothetical protein
LGALRSSTASFQVKLVSIDAAEIADGNPSLVLGLIWNIILFFQVSLPLSVTLEHHRERSNHGTARPHQGTPRDLVSVIHIPLFSDGDQEMKTEAHCLVTKVIR